MYIIKVEDEGRERPKGQGPLSPKKYIKTWDHKEPKDAKRRFPDVPKY
jgi:hypothetical protein